MMLNEDNYREKINSMRKENWKPIVELIPRIEFTTKFGEWNKIEERGGVVIMPGMSWAPVVSEFHEIIYKIPIMISFNWGSWAEGGKMSRDPNFDFDSIDIPTKCKLITAIARSERFHEGALVSAFESGLILKILKSIERQLG